MKFAVERKTEIEIEHGNKYVRRIDITTLSLNLRIQYYELFYAEKTQ